MEILAELNGVVLIVGTVLLAFGFLVIYWAITTLLSSVSELMDRSLARIRVRSIEQRSR